MLILLFLRMWVLVFVHLNYFPSYYEILLGQNHYSEDKLISLI